MESGEMPAIPAWQNLGSLSVEASSMSLQELGKPVVVNRAQPSHGRGGTVSTAFHVKTWLTQGIPVMVEGTQLTRTDTPGPVWPCRGQPWKRGAQQPQLCLPRACLANRKQLWKGGCSSPLLVLQSLPGPAIKINGRGQCSFLYLGPQGLSSPVKVSCGTGECSLPDLGPEVISGFAWVNHGRGGHRIPKVSLALDRVFMKEESQLKYPNSPRPLRPCLGQLWNRRAQFPWPGSPGNGRLRGSQNGREGTASLTLYRTV